jgi:Na+-driven multidrug efflux pump
MLSGSALDLGMRAMIVCMWSVPLLNAGTLVSAIMRAGKQMTAPTVTTLCGLWFVQFPLTWWLSAHGDRIAIWKAYAAAYAVIGIAQLLYFAVWMKREMGAADAAPIPA